MVNDAQLLAQVPDFIRFGGFMKASAALENGERFIYIEASNEELDHQNEVVSQDALRAQAEYFLRHGNIDISHYTIMGPKANIPNFMEYEVGKPVDVQFVGKSTFVKAQLYRGDSAMARNADMIWESMTKQSPPARWYASVGGAVLPNGKEIRIDNDGNRHVVITGVRWNNLALDRCPVNKSVPEISLAPMAVFAKSMGGYILSDIHKTLTAGYGTDSATLTGGGALRTQSLDGAVAGYEDFSERMREICLRFDWEGARGLTALAAERLGLSSRTAAEWVGRFLRDLEKHRSKKQ